MPSPGNFPSTSVTRGALLSGETCGNVKRIRIYRTLHTVQAREKFGHKKKNNIDMNIGFVIKRSHYLFLCMVVITSVEITF